MLNEARVPGVEHVAVGAKLVSPPQGWAYPLSLANSREDEPSDGRWMKILYITPYFWPDPGAASVRAQCMVRAWTRLGHRVTVLSGRPGYPSGMPLPSYGGVRTIRSTWHGAEVVRTWTLSARNSGVVRRSLSFLSFFPWTLMEGAFRLSRPDVVVATSPHPISASVGAALSKRFRCPWVLDLRDLWPEALHALNISHEQSPAFKALRLMEMGLLRSANLVTPVTPAFCADIIGRGVSEQKVFLVPNGFDAETISTNEPKDALRRELGLGDRFVVGYVGNHGVSHGLPSVLAAAHRLRDRDDIVFLFVGHGGERAALERQAESMGLANVRFQGEVPREDLGRVYAAIDVALVTLKRGALFEKMVPAKLYEVLGAAKPVVLSVAGEARRLLEASGGGVAVPPENPEALAAAVVRLKEDDNALRQMGEQGRSYVLQHYDRAAIAAMFAERLESLVAEAGDVSR